MAPGTGLAPAGGRAGRVAARARNPKWKPPPLRIDMSICINCDACLRACPSQFGAIFNHDVDVVIVPELCSGCEKCLPACPVDCIVADPDWSPAPEDWWAHPESPSDPYT
ncbi:MAG: 4Fe-4S binding protein [Acidimicrobiia bacterium]